MVKRKIKKQKPRRRRTTPKRKVEMRKAARRLMVERKVKTKDLCDALEIAADFIKSVHGQLKKQGEIGFTTLYREGGTRKPLEKSAGC